MPPIASFVSCDVSQNSRRCTGEPVMRIGMTTMKGGAAKAVRGAQAGLSSPTRGPQKSKTLTVVVSSRRSSIANTPMSCRFATFHASVCTLNGLTHADTSGALHASPQRARTSIGASDTARYMCASSMVCLRAERVKFLATPYPPPARASSPLPLPPAVRPPPRPGAAMGRPGLPEVRDPAEHGGSGRGRRA